MKNDYFVLLDDALNGKARLYRQLVRIDFLPAAEISRLDDCLSLGQADGLHMALLADYAFGEALQGIGQEGILALYWFAAFSYLHEAETVTWLTEREDNAPAGVADIRMNNQERNYTEAVEAIQAAIARGETYQINYTVRLHCTVYGQPETLYLRLRERQRVPYGALASLPDVNGDDFALLSFSPELFLCVDGQEIMTEPMKGTAPILGDGADGLRRTTLQNDPKNRAENVMIVDLLRNDLGKIAETGSVTVPQRFAVNAFGAVWQMTSIVRARLRAGTTMAEIFRAAYPCGSITGAPKRKSMEIIRSSEATPRGWYTGTLGFLQKTDHGFSGSLNVLIRTLILRPQKGLWDGEMGIGSGIVADSRAGDEWEECAVKARFLHTLPPLFSLIETLRVENGQCALLSQHLARLCASAKILGFVCDLEQIVRKFNTFLAELPPDTPQRIRLLLSATGTSTFTGEALATLPEGGVKILLSSTPLPDNWLRCHKTTARKVYDKGLVQAQAAGAFEMVYFNAADELLEGARTNVFVCLDGAWYTPPVSLGVLPGVMRAEVLNCPQNYLGAARISERPITRSELYRAEKIVLSNALRGILPVCLPLLP